MLLLSLRAGCCGAFPIVRSSCTPSRRAPLPRGLQHGPGVTVRRCGERRATSLEWGQEAGVEVAAGEAWPGAAPRVASSAGGHWRGWGPSAEGVGACWRAKGTGFPLTTIGRFEPLDWFMSVLSFLYIVEFGRPVFMLRLSLDCNFHFSYCPCIK